VQLRDERGSPPDDRGGGIFPVKYRKNTGARLYRRTHAVSFAGALSGIAKSLFPFLTTHHGTLFLKPQWTLSYPKRI
jgi:hypothetical protein